MAATFRIIRDVDRDVMYIRSGVILSVKAPSDGWRLSMTTIVWSIIDKHGNIISDAWQQMNDRQNVKRRLHVGSPDKH